MLADIRLLVDDMVRDVAGRLDQASRDRAIALAVVQYGKDVPRTRVSDLVALPGAVGAAFVHLDLPVGWDDGASRIVTLEYPAGYMPPRIVPRHCWDLVKTPDSVVIGLPQGLAAGETCRLTWSLPHVVSDVEDTVPETDREALAQYAAALLLDQVASDVSGDQSSTIKADSVDHGATSANFAARARTARARYHELLGIDPKRLRPASATVAPALAATTGQRRLLWRR
ncbi:MAG: hypothetical protein PHS60_02560 [Zavarzinia sp.]|nr:hypothetical protein [Zavarzinia sp.]